LGAGVELDNSRKGKLACPEACKVCYVSTVNSGVTWPEEEEEEEETLLVRDRGNSHLVRRPIWFKDNSSAK
jgi:hypothetical protein